jgi:hypothetical protein
MRALRAHGIAAVLPGGFEGQIFRRQLTDRAVTMPVAQFATFPLPAQVGDFGGGAVDLMGPSDVFVVLFEYGPESLGRALFARKGMPRQLGARDFRRFTLRRGLPGQSGTQWFFTEADRPFTLYVVLGSHLGRVQLLPRLNALLEGITVLPTAFSSPTTTGSGT